MRIIIDECVPSIVKRIADRNIVSVQEMGWAGIKNGELLKRVAAEFDVFITSDKNLRYQQNLSAFDLSIILLPSNQVPVVRSLLPKIDSALGEMQPNNFVEIEP
ncbi:MAG: DUF5615 family PIN-like protein [Acidobacteria bacterium]|nr:DUF5615 family PIN-like protein [Acidobacteriota bacterium]MBP9111063.1 DUF5615 family PIN-like protein [Pyrinomonadaceae bacterium]